MTKAIVDLDTGEMVNLKHQKYKAFTKDGVKLPAHKKGSSCWTDAIISLQNDYAGALAKWSRFLVGKTGIIGYKKNKKVIAYTRQELLKMIDVGRDKGTAMFSYFLQNKIIKETLIDSTDCYIMNPIYFLANPCEITIGLLIHFQDEVWDYLTQYQQRHFLSLAREDNISLKTHSKVGVEVDLIAKK